MTYLNFQGIRFKQVAGLINPMCFSDWFILRRTLEHFDSHGRESLLNCVLRAINRHNNPDLRSVLQLNSLTHYLK